MILEDSASICQGFEVTKKIHDPVVKEATVNGMRARAVQDEIIGKNTDFKQQYDRMKQDVASLRKKHDAAKVSRMWLGIPIAGWAYYLKQKQNRKKYEQQLEGRQGQVTEAEASIFNIQKVLVQVEDHLLPALQAYLESIQGLQAIFQ